MAAYTEAKGSRAAREDEAAAAAIMAKFSAGGGGREKGRGGGGGGGGAGGGEGGDVESLQEQVRALVCVVCVVVAFCGEESGDGTSSDIRQEQQMLCFLFSDDDGDYNGSIAAVNVRVHFFSKVGKKKKRIARWYPRTPRSSTSHTRGVLIRCFSFPVKDPPRLS